MNPIQENYYIMKQLTNSLGQFRKQLEVRLFKQVPTKVWSRLYRSLSIKLNRLLESQLTEF